MIFTALLFLSLTTINSPSYAQTLDTEPFRGSCKGTGNVVHKDHFDSYFKKVEETFQIKIVKQTWGDEVFTRKFKEAYSNHEYVVKAKEFYLVSFIVQGQIWSTVLFVNSDGCFQRRFQYSMSEWMQLMSRIYGS